MRSQQQQTQQQFDLYYQALLYPLGGPHAHTFQHLKQQKVTYQPSKKQLSYIYELENFQNIDRKKQPLTYTSKLVENKSNYFYSVFDQMTGTFVWRNVNGFMEMRPKPAVNREGTGIKTQTGKQSKKQQVQEVQPSIQLTVIQSGSGQNLSQKQLMNAPVSQSKPTWQCSKSQYFSYLSN